MMETDDKRTAIKTFSCARLEFMSSRLFLFRAWLRGWYKIMAPTPEEFDASATWLNGEADSAVVIVLC